jgi:hypothetical protein
VITFHFQVTFLGIPMINIGQRYCELLRLHKRVEGVDFIVSSFKLGNIIYVDYIKDTHEGTVKRQEALAKSKDGNGDDTSVTGRPRQQVNMDAASKKLDFIRSVEDPLPLPLHPSLPPSLPQKRASLNSIQPRLNPLAVRRGSAMKRDGDVARSASVGPDIPPPPRSTFHEPRPSLAFNSNKILQVNHMDTMTSDMHDNSTTLSFSNYSGSASSEAHFPSQSENPLHDDSEGVVLRGRDALSTTLPVTEHAMSTSIANRVVHYELIGQGKDIDEEDEKMAQNEALKARRVSLAFRKNQNDG